MTLGAITYSRTNATKMIKTILLSLYSQLHSFGRSRVTRAYDPRLNPTYYGAVSLEDIIISFSRYNILRSPDNK